MIKNRLVDYGIANKKALVVGGTRELGLEIALQLLKSGCKVYIIGRNNITLKKTLNYFKKTKFNKKVEGFIVDVSSTLETNELIKKFKNKKINFDIIVYNAGRSAAVKDSLVSRNEYKKIWESGNQGTSFKKIFDCINWCIKVGPKSVSGRNISVVHDKWGTKKLKENLDKFHDMYKLRRFKETKYFKF